MQLGLILAKARNGVVGKDGGMPWHLPEDLAHFKRITLGSPVIMGRRTWDSLPTRFRPLPGRTNIVVTRQATWQGEGAARAGSLAEALALCGDAPRVWVIGGAQLWAQAIPQAQIAEVTELDADFDGDTYAPALGPGWAATSREQHRSAGGLDFCFVTYRKT